MKKIVLLFLFFGSFVFGQNLDENPFNKYFQVSDTLAKYEFRLIIDSYISQKFKLYQIRRVGMKWEATEYFFSGKDLSLTKRNLNFKTSGDEFWLNLYNHKIHTLKGTSYIDSKVTTDYEYYINDEKKLRVRPRKGMNIYTDNDTYSTLFSSEDFLHEIIMDIPQWYLKRYPEIYEVIEFNKFLDYFEKEFDVRFSED